MKDQNKPIIMLKAMREGEKDGCSIELNLGGTLTEFSSILAQTAISIGESACEGKTDNKLVHIQAAVIFLESVFDDIRGISKNVIDSMGMEEAFIATIEAMSFRSGGQPSCPDEQCESCKLNIICHSGEKTTSTEPIQTTQENKNVQ